MDVMAIVLSSLKRYHRAFVIGIMDQLFEEIMRACERNDFKESQRRIAMIKFVGESYNYKVIYTKTLFDLLYRLLNINFIQEENFFEQKDSQDDQQLNKNLTTLCFEDEYMKSLDSPGDSFRIRLICTVLDSLGKYF
jgi:regulator of nonsense transcripts 2